MKTRTNRRLDLLPRPELQVVRPLEEPWRALLDDLARSRGFPTTSDVATLGDLVGKLSATYNATGPEVVNARGESMHAARLLFSFPRDVPKSAAAIRQLATRGDVALPKDRPLRILDLGAGLGATTWGVARALSRSAGNPADARLSIAVTMVDADPLALNLALAIADRVAQLNIEPNLHLTIEETRGTGLGAYHGPAGTADSGFDLILVGQMISEIDRALDAELRVENHAKKIATWLGWLRTSPGAALVIVEPALRDRSRHLHAVRDRVLERMPEVQVLAPCLHEAPCPALAIEGEWCHDDVPIDLPEWLAPVARAAGLRWQNLSFTPLVLANGPRARVTRDGATEGRVISDALVSKGKIEAFVCAPIAQGAARLRVMRLDRHAGPATRAWDELARYDRLQFTPPIHPDDAGRVRLVPDAIVRRSLAAPEEDGEVTST